MDYDLNIVRVVFRAFGRPGEGYTDTKRMLQAIPHVAGHDPKNVRAHFDRLIELGLVNQTGEIKMRHHPHPATWRASDTGSEWVWRAWQDRLWDEGAPTLRRRLAGEAE